MRASSAALAAATMAVVAGGAAAGDAQEQRELRVPDDARVTILGAKFAPGFPRSTPVEAAGDVNGDGTPDLLVRNRQEHAGDQTHSYLIFGGRLPARLSLDRLGRSGRALLKSAAGDRIIPVGDVNGDRRADLARCDLNGRKAQILLGGQTVGTRRGDTVVGAACLKAPGDVDGDGLTDLLLVRYSRDGRTTGTVLFSSRGPRRTIDVARLGRRGFQLAAGRFADVTPVGDLNGDRRADVGVAELRGRTVLLKLVFGLRRTGTLDVRRATFPVVTATGLARFEPAGDVNGDGAGDLAVVEGERGCVLFGRRGGWPARSGCTAAAGLVVAADAGESAVTGLTAAGDLDRDGYHDLFARVSERRGPRTARAPGALMIVYGRRDPGRVVLSTDPRTTRITAHPDLGEGWVGDYASPGDVTADGRPDVVIGSGWSGDAWVLSPAIE